MMKLRHLFTFIILTLFCDQAVSFNNFSKSGITSGLSIPRYVSLKEKKVKLRIGPGKKYKTKYLYVLQNLPVKIVEEFDNWRKVQDVEGTEGWIHVSMLSGKSYALVVDNKKFLKEHSVHYIPHSKNALMFSLNTENSSPVAHIELGTLVKLKKCRGQWCKVTVDSVLGWIRIENLFGAN